MKVRNYTELVVWQKAMDLVELVYKVTASFPNDERFGLTSQMRRAAVSIPCNIAEGQGRTTTRDFLHFLSISYGSLREVETQIWIAQRLAYLKEESATNVFQLTAEVGRLINGLSNSLRRREQ